MLTRGLPVVGVTHVPGPVVLVVPLSPSCRISREGLGLAGVSWIVTWLVGLSVSLLWSVGSSSSSNTWSVPITASSPSPSPSPGLVVVTPAVGRLDVSLEKLRVSWQHWIDEVCEVWTSWTHGVVAWHGSLEETSREV